MEGFYYKLYIPVESEEHQEIILAMIADEEISAVEQDDSGLTIYHESAEVLDRAKSTAESLPFLDSELSIEQLPLENWNKKWEESFQPIIVGNFCGVRASFHEPLEEVKHEIIIDPELAFGTGHHETTYMMMQQMELLDFAGTKVFDFGCGTAILAILAHMLGAEDIYGIDYDEQAIKCAHDCIQLNDTDTIRLEACVITDTPVEQYDIILANINRQVLLDSAEELNKRLAPEGVLVLSGLLVEDEPIITERYDQVGFEKVSKINKGEWISLKMKHGRK